MGSDNDSSEPQSLGARSDGLSPRMRARIDALYAQMQTPANRRAVQAAMNASPLELGEAAVRQARRDLEGLKQSG